MNEKTIGRLIQTIDTVTAPPEGLKETLLIRILTAESQVYPVLTPLERFLFEKPLRAACLIAASVSGSLWAILGSGFAKVLGDMIG